MSAGHDTLSLVVASDAAYAHGLALVLWSARRLLASKCLLDVRVFDGGLADGDAAALDRVLRRAGGPYTLTLVPAPPVKDLEKGNTKNALTFARLYIPEVFPDLERALYLDSDILVHRDLSAVLDLPFDGALACAVVDTGNPTLGGPLEELPLAEFQLPPTDAYFNAGVLWMDVAAWRTTRAGEETLKLARERAETWMFQDQSVLNLTFHRRWREIDESWNRQVWLSEYQWEVTPPGPAILHFTDHKPWRFPLDRPVGINRRVARYLRASGWMEHRAPVPDYRNPAHDSWRQRVKELLRWWQAVRARRRRRSTAA